MSSFADLRARTLSAVVMIAVGAGAIWAGGLIFTGLVAVLVGLMVYELLRMLDPEKRLSETQARAFAAGAWLFVAAVLLPEGLRVPALLLPVLIFIPTVPRDRVVFALYMALIMFAGLGLIILRDDFGLYWVLWLVALVIGSDVAGYFAGRLLGGPKLWPRVSPKKTWSGTVAGWLLAALIGAGFLGVLEAGVFLILLSVLVAMAGQAGDIAESAIKRHAGVKDSSNLIPGHGGVLDRFDAMIAAAALVVALATLGLLG